MKTFYKAAGALLAAATAAVFVAKANVAAAPDTTNLQAQLDRGRYLLRITGCNDCHTPGYMETDGAVPESEWLTGDSLGWRGPWGTTYPANLRLYLQDLSEDEWVTKARALKTLPPMPWFAVNAMSEEDLRSVYQFIRSLGPKGEKVPAYVAPNTEPSTPYFIMVPQAPKTL